MAVVQQGMDQQTPAIKTLLRGVVGRSIGSTRKRKARTTRKATKRTKTARRKSSGKAARFVKGSAAAKAFMARLRAKRKK